MTVDSYGTTSRRDFLSILSSAMGAVGAGSLAYWMIDTMEPAQDVLAAGNPIDIDLSKMAEGQQIVVMWRGKPIFVVDRGEAALKGLQDPALESRLRDPASQAKQQPDYALNWHRSADPRYAVLVGICTHLGCVPRYMPEPSASDPAPNWPGGFFCPCHGSKYDLAGRVYAGVPAPYNLPVPPYHLVDAKTLRVGENPPGDTFDLNAVVQI